jgi:hypothetical protein
LREKRHAQHRTPGECLEAQQPPEDHGVPFLWFDGRQTYEQALAAAGLLDHKEPVFPIKIIGVTPGDLPAR